MKYIADITKPPIPPPTPPCRTFKEIGMFFPVRVETTESKALTDQYNNDNKAWLNYIEDYKLTRCKQLEEIIIKNKLKQQENNIDFEI